MIDKKLKNKIILGVIAFILFIVVVNSITTVKTGFVGVKTRFGAVMDTTISEGINLIAFPLLTN